MFLHFVLSEIVPSVPRPHLKCLVLREFWQLLDKWYATASTAIDNLGVADGTFLLIRNGRISTQPQAILEFIARQLR